MTTAQHFALTLFMLSLGFHWGYEARDLRGHVPGNLFAGTFLLAWVVFFGITVFNIGMEVAKL